MATKTNFVFGRKEAKNAENLEVLNGLAFPAEFIFENLTPRNLCFPEIQGLFMRSITAPDGSNKVDVEVKSFESLVNVINSIWQIAELNKYDDAVKIAIKTNEKAEKSVEKVVAKKDKSEKTEKTEKPANSNPTDQLLTQ